MTAIPCPKCSGSGCRYCNNIGAVGRDETNDYYLTKSADNKFQVGGIIEIKSSPNIFVKFLSKLFEEPHDFLWSIKQKR